MSDKYEYDDVDEKAKLFARIELNEVPSQVNEHIERLRKRVKSMPHLHCPLDAKFLLRFLRVSRFDHEKALRRLDNFCTVRSSQRGSPNFFNYFKLDDPILKKFLNLKYILPLGHTDAGEYVMIFKTNVLTQILYSFLNSDINEEGFVVENLDVDHFPFLDFVRLCYMVMDVVLSLPEMQIFGLKWVEDLEEASTKVFEYFDKPKLTAQFYTIFQDYLPLRMKAQIFCNSPPIFEQMFEKTAPYMKESLKTRTFNFEGDTKKVMEKVGEVIPGLEKILPKEYGGHGGTLDECIERWNKRFNEYFKNGDPLSSIHVDESKRPKETLAYFSKYEKLNEIV